MDEEWDDAVGECQPGKFRFLAKFSWEWFNDESAEQAFTKWPSLTKKGQGYYLTGTRTFLLIDSAADDNEVIARCKEIINNRPIDFKYYRARRTDEP